MLPREAGRTRCEDAAIGRRGAGASPTRGDVLGVSSRGPDRRDSGRRALTRYALDRPRPRERAMARRPRRMVECDERPSRPRASEAFGPPPRDAVASTATRRAERRARPSEAPRARVEAREFYAARAAPRRRRTARRVAPRAWRPAKRCASGQRAGGVDERRRISLAVRGRRRETRRAARRGDRALRLAHADRVATGEGRRLRRRTAARRRGRAWRASRSARRWRRRGDRRECAVRGGRTSERSGSSLRTERAGCATAAARSGAAPRARRRTSDAERARARARGGGESRRARDGVGVADEVMRRVGGSRGVRTRVAAVFHATFVVVRARARARATAPHADPPRRVARRLTKAPVLRAAAMVPPTRARRAVARGRHRGRRATRVARRIGLASRRPRRAGDPAWSSSTSRSALNTRGPPEARDAHRRPC